MPDNDVAAGGPAPPGMAAYKLSPENQPTLHDGTCVPMRMARAVVVGWGVWTGAVAFVVGHWWDAVPSRVLGAFWVMTVIWLVQEWADA